MENSQSPQKQSQESVEQLKNEKKANYAKLLLQSYRERSKEQQDMTIDEYLNWYAEKIGPAPQEYFKKQQKEELSRRYRELKQELNEKVSAYQQELTAKKGVILPYAQFKDLIGRKQLATLKAMNSQLSTYQQSGVGQELARVNKIIANGAWGCLDRLQQRLAKLHQLQSTTQ